MLLSFLHKKKSLIREKNTLGIKKFLLSYTVKKLKIDCNRICQIKIPGNAKQFQIKITVNFGILHNFIITNLNAKFVTFTEKITCNHY